MTRPSPLPDTISPEARSSTPAPWGPITLRRAFASALVVACVLQIPTIPQLYDHAARRQPARLSIALLAVTAIGVLALLVVTPRWPTWRRVAGSAPATMALLVGISIVAIVIHERPSHIYPQGLPQAQAMILPAQALFHGRAMDGVTLPPAPARSVRGRPGSC
ncbi:MAG: hypothetical protein M3Y36_03475 [Actinomycetota bacterium]|nr:hypothetical protein [Actinomycetota bacterium]